MHQYPVRSQDKNYFNPGTLKLLMFLMYHLTKLLKLYNKIENESSNLGILGSGVECGHKKFCLWLTLEGWRWTVYAPFLKTEVVLFSVDLDLLLIYLFGFRYSENI